MPYKYTPCHAAIDAAAAAIRFDFAAAFRYADTTLSIAAAAAFSLRHTSVSTGLRRYRHATMIRF